MTDDFYGLGARARHALVEAPSLEWRPRNVDKSRHIIGLIGCGGIAEQHLLAYARAGLRVAALLDHTLAKAVAYRDRFFPSALATASIDQLMEDESITVLDLTPHVHDRAPLLEKALLCGKHVLTQKPFTTTLTAAETLVLMADERGLRLAVNQNGRFAPHFAWTRAALAADLLGEPVSASFEVHWDHGWVAGTAFDAMEHLLLFDFAIHWLDMARAVFLGQRALSVFATVCHDKTQTPKPPLVGQVVVQFESGHASLSFNGARRVGQWDRTHVAGTKGTLLAEGPDLQQQRVTLITKEGIAHPILKGQWFPDAFGDAMAALLSGIEHGATMPHEARDNIDTLALCFAAVESSKTGRPVVPGTVRRLPA